MGFSTVDQLVNAMSNAGSMQRLIFQKFMASAPVASVPHTLWKANGAPVAGTDPTSGAANGRVLTSASTGAIPYGNAPSGTNHLITVGAGSQTATPTGILILVDRIADVNLSVAAAAGAITGCTGTSRMAATTAPGDGGQLWAEVTTAFSATTSTGTVVFAGTNQLGTTASPVTVSLTLSAVIGRSPNAQLWQNNGINSTTSSFRSLDSITTAATTVASGAYNMCIVRPLGTLPLMAQSQWIERDFVVEIPNLPFIYSSACLSLLYVPTTAVQQTIFGELRMCYN